MIPKILTGEKTIESRWYQAKRTPWDRIRAGDTIYFKDSGEMVTARADVCEVLQFELCGINDARKVVKTYGTEICIVEKDPKDWKNVPRYCILIRLIHPATLSRPFAIDRTGFGSGAAWLSVQNIETIQKIP